MADTLPVTPRRLNQVLRDTDPQSTEARMRAAGMDLEKYGSCAEPRRHRALPKSERVLGCPCWDQCTLHKIKGKAGPINLPYRLYKKGGLVREGWGPCFTVFRMAAQYNLGDDNFIMEILPLSETVDVRGSRAVTQTDGTVIWEDFLEQQTVPPFPKLGDRGMLVGEQQRQKVREKQINERRKAMIDHTMNISPEDIEQGDRKE